MTTDNKTYRVRFVHDDDAEFEECNGQARPLTEAEYAEHSYQKDGRSGRYAENLDYYGTPGGTSSSGPCLRSSARPAANGTASVHCGTSTAWTTTPKHRSSGRRFT